MIESLHFQSFKCFRRLRLTLRPLTLLTGLNGAGKSSILQGLLALRQSHAEGTLHDEGLLLNGPLVELGTADDVLYQWADDTRLSLELNDSSWQFAFDDDARGRDLDMLPLARENTKPAPTAHTHALFSDAFHYLQAERMGPRSAYPVSEYQVHQKHQLGTQGEYTSQFLAIFGGDSVLSELRHHPKAESASLRDQTEAWLGEICPGVKMHTLRSKEFERANLRYSFTGAQHTTSQFRAQNVGFGITYTLPVIVALLSSPRDGLVLLENPEAHLHPKGQRLMGYLLGLTAASGTQIVVETHSEQLLSGVRLAIFADKLTKEDTALCHFTRQESGDTFEVIARQKQPERHHNIDEGPHTAFDQWEAKEAKLKAATLQESLLWGDPEALEVIDIPEDRSGWDAESYKRNIDLLLLAGAHLKARELAQEGAQQHPDQEDLQEKASLLAPPNTSRTSLPKEPEGPKRNREWLASHREEYKGKWVALRADQLIESADSFAELKQKLGAAQLQNVFVVQVR